MIYLDNAATTKIHPEVLQKMIQCLNDIYGNANSRFYNQAIMASNSVSQARINVAKLLNAKENNIIFTSGSTESNNFVLKSLWLTKDIKHIITSKVEHSSILETCKYLETKGVTVTYLDVNSLGQISLIELEKEINETTGLVSIMWVNNEVGSVNPIKEISEICAKKKIPFHTDATQALGKINIDLTELQGLSFASFSAHKIYGPKGVGAVYIRDLTENMVPLIHGGEQELGYRGGTLPTHQIVGFGEAARVCLRDYKKNHRILLKLENRFIELLKQEYQENIEIVSCFHPKVPGIVSVRFIGVNNEILLKSISKSVAASTGAACSNSKPSHVMKALGYSLVQIREIIRFSFSPYDEYSDFKDLL
jgi:cysteine desulfurase